MDECSLQINYAFFTTFYLFIIEMFSGLGNKFMSSKKQVKNNTHLHVHTYACMHTYPHAHTHTRMHTYTHAHTPACTHTHTHAHTLSTRTVKFSDKKSEFQTNFRQTYNLHKNFGQCKNYRLTFNFHR